MIAKVESNFCNCAVQTYTQTNFKNSPQSDEFRLLARTPCPSPSTCWSGHKTGCQKAQGLPITYLDQPQTRPDFCPAYPQYEAPTGYCQAECLPWQGNRLSTLVFEQECAAYRLQTLPLSSASWLVPYPLPKPLLLTQLPNTQGHLWPNTLCVPMG